MKILAIGNSFSQNAMAYLERMAAAGKENFVLGNLVIGGCSLEKHCGNMENDKPEYAYEIRSNGGKVTLLNHKMSHALKSDDWDIITLQQVSQLGGKPDSFEPYLKKLVDYIRKMQPNAEILLHETWSYEKTTEHDGFKLYNCVAGVCIIKHFNGVSRCLLNCCDSLCLTLGLSDFCFSYSLGVKDCRLLFCLSLKDF